MVARLSVGRAIEAWQPFYKEPLRQADGEEIVETMSAYLSFIADWVAKQRNAQGH